MIVADQLQRGPCCMRSKYAAALGGVLVIAALFVHQAGFRTATPSSRLVLLGSICTDHTLAIDRWHSVTPDIARKDGRYYSDKAPGTAALALPAFTVAAGGLKLADIPLDSTRGWLTASWAACAFSQALPAVLGAVAVMCWLGRFVVQRAALIAVLALTLGSLPLPYSTLLFSHAQVIGLIGIAIWALGLFQAGGSEGIGDGSQQAGIYGNAIGCRGPVANGLRAEIGVRPGRMALAGFCLGLALASEYTAGLVVVGLGAYVVRHRRAGLWPFVIAAIPPLLLIPAYSWATIGTPFALPYSYQASFPEMKEGLYAIRWPDLENLGRLMIGPTRGLIFWTPFLVMAGFGWVWMAKERPRWLWLTYALPVLHALVISGRTWDWQAGYTISARYMAPILPLLALPCAIGTQRWPKSGGVLAIVSIAVMTLATITDACPDFTIYNPLTELHIPKFLRGEFSYTLGTEVLGLPPWISVGLYYAILIGGIAWLWRLASRADREQTCQPLMNPDERG